MARTFVMPITKDPLHGMGPGTICRHPKPRQAPMIGSPLVDCAGCMHTVVLHHDREAFAPLVLERFGPIASGGHEIPHGFYGVPRKGGLGPFRVSGRLRERAFPSCLASAPLLGDPGASRPPRLWATRGEHVHRRSPSSPALASAPPATASVLSGPSVPDRHLWPGAWPVSTPSPLPGASVSPSKLRRLSRVCPGVAPPRSRHSRASDTNQRRGVAS